MRFSSSLPMMSRKSSALYRSAAARREYLLIILKTSVAVYKIAGDQAGFGFSNETKSHPTGEWKLQLAKREEMLMSCTGGQTVAGRVQVRRESESAATPMGQLAYFIEFLPLTGLWSRW